MKKIVLRGKKGIDKFTIVDDSDYEKVKDMKWYLTWNGYVVAKNNLRMHRFIMDCPKQLKIDHRNHNILDNRRENLRICTSEENNHNRVKLLGTTSKYKGVYWNKETSKWRSKIRASNKLIHLGYFISELQAAIAYNQAAKQHHGEFAYLNSI